MTDTELQAGDVVKLKSGGPLMTVAEAGLGTDKTGVKCTWFSSNDMRREDTLSGVLRKRTAVPA